MAQRPIELIEKKKGTGTVIYEVRGTTESRKISVTDIRQSLKARGVDVRKVWWEPGGKVYVKTGTTGLQSLQGLIQRPEQPALPDLPEKEGYYKTDSGTMYHVDKYGQVSTVLPDAAARIEAQSQAYEARYQPYTSSPFELKPEAKKIIESQPSFPEESLKPGAIALAREMQKPQRQSYEERQQELAEREAEKIWSGTSPAEKAGLHAHTLLSERGGEYIGSYVAPFFGFPGKTPEHITKETLADIQRIKTEQERQSYVLRSAVFNPVVETEMMFLGGFGAGAAAARLPRLGAIAASKSGKVAMAGLGASYAGGVGYEAYGEYQRGEYAKMFGTSIMAGVSAVSLGKGFKAGQKYGGGLLLKAQAKELGEGVKFAKKMEKVKSEWLIEPKDVEISQLPKGYRKSAFETIGKEKGTVFGTTAKEAQFKPSLRAGTADVDVAVKNTRKMQKELLKLGIPGAKPKGQGIVGKDGHMFDIKSSSRYSRFQSFPHKQKPLTTPGGKKITRLGEESWRALHGVVDRGGRAGWQGMKDIVRFSKSIETAIASKEIQIKQSSLPFKEFRLGRLEKLKTEFMEFKQKEPKLTSELRAKARKGKLEEPVFVESSYLPRWGGRSMLPKVPRSILPARPSRSILPRGPSGLSPSPKPPSLIPPSRAPPSGIPIVPSSIIPSGIGSSLIKSPSRLPPSKIPPTPIIVPPPRIPDIATEFGKLPRFGMGLEERPKKRKKRKPLWATERGYKYAPSLTAIVSGIRSSIKPAKLTGLGIRPVVSKKRK